MNGIEDRYRINLQPAILAKLEGSFSCQQPDSFSNPMLPDNFSSVTFYRFQNPAVAGKVLRLRCRFKSTQCPQYSSLHY